MRTSAVLPATPVSPTAVHTAMNTSAMSHCHAHKCNVTLSCTQVQCYPPHPLPPHLYTLPCTQVQCYPPLWQLHSDFGDISSGVCHAMKNTIVESHPNVGQQGFCFSPSVATGDSTEMPVTTMVHSLGSGAARWDAIPPLLEGHPSVNRTVFSLRHLYLVSTEHSFTCWVAVQTWSPSNTPLGSVSNCSKQVAVKNCYN